MPLPPLSSNGNDLIVIDAIASGTYALSNPAKPDLLDARGGNDVVELASNWPSSTPRAWAASSP